MIARKECLNPPSGFSGVVVRSVNTKYATASDFFSGVGASKSGGRWNRKGLEATYTSLDIETAIKEAYQNLLHYGFPISNIRPRTTAGARVKLKKVLDILDAIDRSRLLLCRLRGPHRPIGP
jgi:RES domain-containing protein